MTRQTPAPEIDFSFPHRWQAEILASRPIILPARHFVYPLQAEEVERLSREIHEIHAVGCDGGLPVRGVAQLLSRQHLVCLLQHFFSRKGWAVEE